jgi:hypothetical protein
MSALLDPSEVVSQIDAELVAVEIREGDWQAYQQLITRPPNNRDLINGVGGVIAYKRACARAYLGKLAQCRGNACTAEPRILTPEFIAELHETNKARRNKNNSTPKPATLALRSAHIRHVFFGKGGVAPASTVPGSSTR